MSVSHVDVEDVRRRGALVALLVLGIVALIGYAVRDAVFTDGPRGPRGSSYASGPTGASHYADLLSRSGHPVERRRLPLDVGRPLDPSTTVVVLDAPELRRSEAVALRAFVVSGGRAVVAGDPGEWLPDLLPGPTWYGHGNLSCRRKVDVPEAVGVTDVVLTGHGRWPTTGRAVPFLECRGVAVGLVQTVGAGRLVLLADSGPVQNQYLAAYDDAVLGVAMVGAGGRHVVFDEQVHGFGPKRGLLALPHGLPLALGLLGLAGALALLAGRPPVPVPTAPVAPAAADRRTAVRERWERTRDLTTAGRVLQHACQQELARGPTRATLDEHELRLAHQTLVSADDLIALAALHDRLRELP